MAYHPPLLPQYTVSKESILGRNVAAVMQKFGLKPEQIVKLGSNENPLGMSERAAAVVSDTSARAARYPSPDGDLLRTCLAEEHGVTPDWIALGAGSSEFISISAAAFVGPGRAAVISDYAFLAAKGAVRRSGGRMIVVPALNFGHDLDVIAAAIDDDVSVVYLVNPNNPTGTYLSGEEITRFLETIPERVVVMLDEAYIHFVEPADSYDTVALVRRFPNLVMMRTFSKAFGLAGMRVGYVLCDPAMAAVFAHFKPIYNVGTLSLVAAVETVKDRGFLEATIENNRRGRKQIHEGLLALGVKFLPSTTNFFMVNVGNAETVNEKLLERGVIVRTLPNYGLPEWFRVSVGLPAENDRFLEALAGALAPGRADA